MAELNNTIVKGNLRVTAQAEIQEVIENGTSLANKYLALSGGTLTGASDAPLVIQSAANYTGSYIQFKNGSGTTIGYLGVNTIDNNNIPVFYDNQNHRLAFYSDIPAAVRYDINSQGLNDTQKSNARTNIGAGTSNFTGYTSSDMLSAKYVYDEGSQQTVSTAFEDIYGMIDDINVVLEEIPTHLYEHTITIEAPYCYTIDGTNFNNAEIMLTFSLISIHGGTITGSSNSLAAFLWNIDDAGEDGDYHATGYMSTVEGSEGWSDFKPSNIAHRISIFYSDFYEDIVLRVYQAKVEPGFNSWYTFLGTDNDDRGTVDITETVRSIY